MFDAVQAGFARPNAIAHHVYREWDGPVGRGSHPLTRVVGKILRRLRRYGLVAQIFNRNSKQFEWH